MSRSVHQLLPCPISVWKAQRRHQFSSRIPLHPVFPPTPQCHAYHPAPSLPNVHCHPARNKTVIIALQAWTPPSSCGESVGGQRLWFPTRRYWVQCDLNSMLWERGTDVVLGFDTHRSHELYCMHGFWKPCLIILALIVSALCMINRWVLQN